MPLGSPQLPDQSAAGLYFAMHAVALWLSPGHTTSDFFEHQEVVLELVLQGTWVLRSSPALLQCISQLPHAEPHDSVLFKFYDLKIVLTSLLSSRRCHLQPAVRPNCWQLNWVIRASSKEADLLQRCFFLQNVMAASHASENFKLEHENNFTKMAIMCIVVVCTRDRWEVGELTMMAQILLSSYVLVDLEVNRCTSRNFSFERITQCEKQLWSKDVLESVYLTQHIPWRLSLPLCRKICFI